jgi:hypothetical protein
MANHGDGVSVWDVANTLTSTHRLQVLLLLLLLLLMLTTVVKSQ